MFLRKSKGKMDKKWNRGDGSERGVTQTRRREGYRGFFYVTLQAHTLVLYSFLFKLLTISHHFHFRNIGEKGSYGVFCGGNSKMLIEALGWSLFLELHLKQKSQCPQKAKC